jgi:hypothetical protein
MPGPGLFHACSSPSALFHEQLDAVCQRADDDGCLQARDDDQRQCRRDRHTVPEHHQRDAHTARQQNHSADKIQVLRLAPTK